MSFFPGLDSERSFASLFSRSVFHSQFSFGYFKASKKNHLSLTMALTETSHSLLFPFWFMQCEADLLHLTFKSVFELVFFFLAKQREIGLKIKISREVSQNQVQSQPLCK